MILKINDRIRNRKVDFFTKFAIEFKYDSIASLFSFDFFFNPENQEHVDLACIGHYHLATLEYNDELLLSGFILNEKFTDKSQKQLTRFSGYSYPGVLEDCQIPVSLYPLQSDGLTLKEIAQKLLKPFNLKMVIDASVSSRMEEVYKTTTAKESQSIATYLTELSSNKKIIVSHTSKGELLFTEANTKSNPILNFDGGIPFDEMSLDFNGQEMHSDITVVKQADIDGGNAGQFTIKNPYVPYVFRPRVIVQSSGTDIDTELVAKTALAEELKNLRLTIKMDRWLVDGKVIKPNNTILVKNPDIYLFKSTKWFIESVKLEGDKEKTVATLSCVLPEVYNGQPPKYIFEGVNTHG